jgi:hypothetical protein
MSSKGRLRASPITNGETDKAVGTAEMAPARIRRNVYLRRRQVEGGAVGGAIECSLVTLISHVFSITFISCVFFCVAPPQRLSAP